jgi:hypothetical protein
LELFAQRALVHRLAGWSGGLLPGAAVLWWLGGGDRHEALLLAALAVPCGLVFAIGWPVAQRIVAAAITPRAIWGLLLVVALGGAHYLSRAVASHDELPNELLIPLANEAVRGLTAQTDAGRSLPLFHYDDLGSLEGNESLTLGDGRYQHKLVKLAGPNRDCNCHGWAFTGGRYAIRGQDVPTILNDNGYTAVREPRPGDVVIYASKDGTITHTGLVQLVDRSRDLVLVESKWGPLGIYLHPLLIQPFGDNHTIYRSDRSGHIVAITPAAPGGLPPDVDPSAEPGHEPQAATDLALRRRAMELWRRALGKSKRPRV